MDPIVEILMAKYGLSAEQAQAYAERMRGSAVASPMDADVKYEAFNRVVSPHVERAKRIYAFQQLNERYHTKPLTLSVEEKNWLDRVKAEEAKRMQQQASAVLAAQKLAARPDPIQAAMQDPAARLRMLEAGAARRKQHADYWSRPENQPRAQELENELLAERKKSRK